MREPAALNTWPPNVYGNWLAQTERFTVEVSSGSSATVIVLIVSQLLMPAIVSVIVPAALNTCPPNVYGNWLAQTDRFTVEVSSGSSATVIVLIVSHLFALGIVSVIVPAALNTCPPNVYGNWLAQTDRFTVEVSNGSSATV